MQVTDTEPSEILKAGLRDAAGIVCAYFVPREYGLDILSVEATGVPSVLDPWQSAIRRRIELTRASLFADWLEGIEGSLSSVYRHEVVYETAELKGKLHMPLYLREIATGRSRGFPVIRAAVRSVTPENFLVSELLRRSIAVTKPFWTGEKAEHDLGRNLRRRLIRLEQNHPWRQIRSIARPRLERLISSVRDRTRSKVISEAPMGHVLRLFGDQIGDIDTITVAEKGLQLMVTTAVEFENKLFELLCLGWLLRSLSELAEAGSLNVYEDRVIANQGQPICEGKLSDGGHRFRLHFQSGVPVETRNWYYEATKRDLRAIFDYVLVVETPMGAKRIILDAKNRGEEESEVIYKLLGYKANVSEPGATYRAAAFFPQRFGTETITELRNYDAPVDRIWNCRLSLDDGCHQMGRFLRLALQDVLSGSGGASAALVS